MENKANFQKVKLNVNKVLTKDYDQMDTWSIRKKQSQTNPNKAKLKKAEMNVTSIITVAYENKPPIRTPKKQSQTNPNKAKLKKAEMNVTSASTKGYENKPAIWAPKKQSQTSKRQKPIQPLLLQWIIKESRFWAPKKQTQFKPKQTQPVVSLSNLFQSQKMLLRMKINPRRERKRDWRIYTDFARALIHIARQTGKAIVIVTALSAYFCTPRLGFSYN